MKDNIQLSDHFTTGRLLRFVFPSILMTIFLSIYTIIDGIFVSNFAGKNAFTAINLIWPYVQMIASIGFMIGSGGSALVAQDLGRGETEAAKSRFTFLILTTFVISAVFAAIGFVSVGTISELAKAEGEVYDNCIIYGRILFAMVPFYTLQYVFQNFFVTAGKPKLGLYVTVFAGVLNMIGDYLFIAKGKMGVAGAGLATASSQFVGALIPVVYFSIDNDSTLRFGKIKAEWDFLKRTCMNGISELFSNIALSLVSIVYNFQLMKLIGENGVDAYGVNAYVSYVFVACFLGYSSGSGPITAFHYGAQNIEEIQNILYKSMRIILTGSILMTLISSAFARELARIFVSYDAELLQMTARFLRIYSFYYLCCGYSIYLSMFFTSLGNGPVSAVISFCRLFVFEVLMVLILPLFFGVDGIWYAPVAGSILSATLSFTILARQNKNYHYLRG